MKKNIITLFLLSLILSSCNKKAFEMADTTWLTQIYANGINNGDSIYVEAGVTLVSFNKDNIFKPDGTVQLMGKGNVFYLINDDEFGLVAADGRKVPAVIESFSSFKASGTWTVEEDNIILEWNTDSTEVTGDLGKCINLDEASASEFMLKYGSVIAQRSADSHSQVLNVVNEWLKQRSKLTFNEKDEEWDTTVDGQDTPVLWQMKK
ncbi:hypothetical protein [Sodaliphilus sp.]|uniref:hypothetical protein n=1 Tax=Sodaliphilus sp. TaxID=2815818 RepID=UPI00388F584F